jgi:L-asparaginase II
MPLRHMAVSFAKLVVSTESAARTVVNAMTSHPDLVAGQGRLCTALMRASAGRILAKVGAEGVYGAALRDRGWGVALKVEDGHGWSAAAALVAILEQLGVEPDDAVLPFAVLPVRNTRGETVGETRAAGRLTLN